MKEEGIVSIYFSEFPYRVKAKEIFQIFEIHGKVAEVIIPPKRNKHCKHFGFVRFSKEEDGRVLAVKLDNIFDDKVKIHANLPRFSRNQVASTGRDLVYGFKKVWEEGERLGRNKGDFGGGRVGET
ncbi:unnamed protein product [Lathyrus sativus]|nr:unnamed protein product [Lathyrus sativus]